MGFGWISSLAQGEDRDAVFLVPWRHAPPLVAEHGRNSQMERDEGDAEEQLAMLDEWHVIVANTAKPDAQGGVWRAPRCIAIPAGIGKRHRGPNGRLPSGSKYASRVAVSALPENRLTAID